MGICEFNRYGKITGTLPYVDDYTGYSEEEEEQKGNYLAIKLTSTSGATIKCSIGNSTEVTLDNTGILVARLTTNKVPLKVVASKDGKSYTRYYRLNDLTLESE